MFQSWSSPINEKEHRALEERISELERELAEQKRAAEMLYRGKEKFIRFLDQLPQPVFEINMEEWLTYAKGSPTCALHKLGCLYITGRYGVFIFTEDHS